MIEASSSRDPLRPKKPAKEMQFMESGPFPWRLTTRPPVWRPPTDVYETSDEVVVRVEIAGMREEDFSIEVDGRYLMIRGSRPDTNERRAYHQMEIRFGEFSSEIELPVPVTANQAQAEYQNGLLRVVLPKALPRRINVEE